MSFIFMAILYITFINHIEILTYSALSILIYFYVQQGQDVNIVTNYLHTLRAVESRLHNSTVNIRQFQNHTKLFSHRYQCPYRTFSLY